MKNHYFGIHYENKEIFLLVLQLFWLSANLPNNNCFYREDFSYKTVIKPGFHCGRISNYHVIFTSSLFFINLHNNSLTFFLWFTVLSFYPSFMVWEDPCWGRVGSPRLVASIWFVCSETRLSLVFRLASGRTPAVFVRSPRHSGSSQTKSRGRGAGMV